MTALTTAQVYALAFAELHDKNKAVTATAIAFAESGARTDAVGDVALQNGTWGPSVGLWQVRSLNAQRGTGGTRDASRLTDPRFNAHSMAVISGGGGNWRPWSTYNTGKHLPFLPAAMKAADGGGGGGGVLGTIGDIVDPFGIGGKVIGGVGGAVNGVGDLAGSVTGFLGNLTNPHFWVRVVMVLGGMATLVVGAMLLKGDLTAEALGAVTGAGKGAAMGAVATKVAAAAV